MRLAAAASPLRQQQRGARQQGLGFGLDAMADMRQQLLRLLEPSLADAQPGQAGQRAGMQCRARALGDPQAGVELPLGVRPATLGGQHAAVGDAALGIQERAAVRR